MNLNIDLHTHETDSLRLSYFLVPWDSELMSRPVAQVDHITVKDFDQAVEDFSFFLKWKKAQGIKFCSCRIPEGKINECLLVQQFDYRYVELNYRPELDLSRAKFEFEEDFKFITATKGDRPELEQMAFRVFRSGRFHDDPKIGSSIGNQRYRLWMSNAFTHSDQEIIKCIKQGLIVAFFVQEHPAKEHVFWSLVGLAPGQEGKGLGGRVWRSHLAFLRDSGIKRISTSISSRNIPVFNLYVSLGFRFPQPSITFHWHA